MLVAVSSFQANVTVQGLPCLLTTGCMLTCFPQAQLNELNAAQQQDDDVDPTAEQLMELQEQLNATQMDVDKAADALAEATQKEEK